MFDTIKSHLFCISCQRRMKIKLLGHKDGLECECESCGCKQNFSEKELINELKQVV
jgi:hypothetical protein